MDENKIDSQELENQGNEDFDNQEIQLEDAPKSKKTKMKSNDKKYISEIQELNSKNEELKDKYLRIVAEYDNYRRRTSKEKIELADNVKSSVVMDFLPVIDDMDRAVQFLDEESNSEVDTDVINGIKLISHKFHEFLRSLGVEEIKAQDQEFDTDLHEAVTKFAVNDEDQKGKVIDVIQKGYTLNGKVIRFAKVVVGE